VLPAAGRVHQRQPLPDEHQRDERLQPLHSHKHSPRRRRRRKPATCALATLRPRHIVSTAAWCACACMRLRIAGRTAVFSRRPKAFQCAACAADHPRRAPVAARSPAQRSGYASAVWRSACRQRQRLTRNASPSHAQLHSPTTRSSSLLCALRQSPPSPTGESDMI
jgi:hypothetical protein